MPLENRAATPRPLIKICGTTSLPDAQLAARAGADYLGVIIEHAPSPRSVSLETARAIFTSTDLPTVAVTVNQSREFLLNIQRELRPAALQLHGDESPELARALIQNGATVWAACDNRERAMQMRDAGASAIVIDARAVQNNATIYGGTGARSDWNLARELVHELVQDGTRVILAGGLHPRNVGEAIEFVQPWMVDVVSGVEERQGVKSLSKVAEFIAAAQLAQPKSTPE